MALIPTALPFYPGFWFFVPGKVYSLDENSSLGSIDSEYDMGSIQRDLKFLGETPSLKEMVLNSHQAPRVTPPFIGLRPANPAMQALSSQKREAHNRSPVSFREGRRASDTSLTQGNPSASITALFITCFHNHNPQTQQEVPSLHGSHAAAPLSPSLSRVSRANQKTDFFSDKGFLLHSSPGIVAFRQHLQNLARTKGILELNKVQLLYEQMGSEEEPSLTSAATQLQDLINSPAQVLKAEIKLHLNTLGQIRRG